MSIEKDKERTPHVSYSCVALFFSGLHRKCGLDASRTSTEKRLIIIFRFQIQNHTVDDLDHVVVGVVPKRRKSRRFPVVLI